MLPSPGLYLRALGRGGLVLSVWGQRGAFCLRDPREALG